MWPREKGQHGPKSHRVEGRGQPLVPSPPPVLSLPSLKEPTMQPAQVALPQDLADQLAQVSCL